jgi:Lipid A 3-O-deacylase (PagL)
MVGRLFFSWLLVLLLGQVPAWGQTDMANKPAWILGSSWQQGAILIHSAKISHLAGIHPVGWEINLQRQTVGKHYWQQLYRYPRLGVSLTFLDYQHPIIGKSLALSPYLSLPLLRGERNKLHFRFGTGLAFFSNRYNRERNPANNIISAHLNAVIQTRLEYEYLLRPNWALLAGVGLNHYSNGGNAKPNLGVNITTASLGLNFYANPHYQTFAREKEALTDRYFFTLSSSLGVKQRNDFDTTRYVVKSLALALSRRVNQKSTLVLGLEGFYDPSLVPRRTWDPRVKPGTTPDIRRVAFNLGHELNLGKVAFGSQVGYYFYRPYKADAALYQRLETRYYLHRFVFIAAGLKLHDVIKADLIEYRLGIRI